MYNYAGDLKATGLDGDDDEDNDSIENSREEALRRRQKQIEELLAKQRSK